MLDIKQFKRYVIIPTLKDMQHVVHYSPQAVELLLGTAVQESRLTYIRQKRGPALGLFQIEPNTAIDVLRNYVAFRADVHQMLYELTGEHDLVKLELKIKHLLQNDLVFQTAMARLIYWRDLKPLPKLGDVEGYAKYWKRVYNTHKGRGTVQEFIKNYRRYVHG